MIFPCPHCQGSIQAEQEHYGMQFACPHCGNPIVIPVAPSFGPNPENKSTPIMPTPEANPKFEGFEVKHEDGQVSRHSSTKSIEEGLLDGSLKRQNLVRFVTPRSTINIPDSLLSWNPIGISLVNQNYPGIYRLYDPISAYQKIYTVVGFLFFLIGGGIGIAFIYSLYLEKLDPGSFGFLGIILAAKFLIIPVLGILSAFLGGLVGGSIGTAVGTAKKKTMRRPPKDGFSAVGRNSGQM